MSIYNEITTANQIPKGEHLARLESVELKVAKSSGKEYLNMKFKTKDQGMLFHSLYFSTGALPMTIKQLKNIKLLGALPIYSSVADLEADGVNFIRKVMELIMMLEKKKFTLKVTGYDDQDRPKMWLEKYSDVENTAIQKDISGSSTDTYQKPIAGSSSDGTDDEIPF